MDPDEIPFAPKVDPALFDRVRTTLEAEGPSAAVAALCHELEQAEDYQNLFYAMLMKKRVELKLPPFPMGPSADLPPEAHEPYEEAIRQAGRHVGTQLLQRGDIPKAWSFFRMLGEPEPVRQALRDYNPGPDADPYPVIEIAWQHGVLPEKGFDLILDRSGVCSSITMVQSSDMSSNPALREYCVKRLIRALHDQLKERLLNDLQSHNVTPPADVTVSQILVGHPELFPEDAYHIDTSHLSSIVQMAMQLANCPEIALARDLCVYGTKLSAGLRGDNDPPFENTYFDYVKFLDVIGGTDVEGGLKHFQAKVEATTADGYQFPAEVLVNLYLKANRLHDALAVAKQHLADANESALSCPSVTELARRAGDFTTLTELAKSKADPVTFLAGLIAAKG